MEKYTKLKELAISNKVEIHKVHYTPLDIDACAKIFKIPKISNEARVASENKHIREAINHASIGDGVNTIKFYEAFIEPSEKHNNAVIIMELCENGDLHKELQRRSRYNERYTKDELFSIAKQFINLLKEFQLKKYCHRDIKPENIFVSDDGTLKLGDFGDAKSRINQKNLTIRGSPFYLSPSLREA